MRREDRRAARAVGATGPSPRQLGRLAAVAGVAAALFLSGRAQAREVTPNPSVDVPAGTIVIRAGEHRLYLTGHDGVAVSYPVAVGKAGKQWYGWSRVDGKYVEPAWSPPDDVRRDNPRLPNVIAGGSPHNPMGVRALTLEGGDYAIHGTNRPGSVGTNASYGCFRMLNRDIVDLYERVRVGTAVLVTR